MISSLLAWPVSVRGSECSVGSYLATPEGTSMRGCGEIGDIRNGREDKRMVVVDVANLLDFGATDPANGAADKRSCLASGLA